MGELLPFPQRALTGADATLSRGCELFAIPGLTGDRVALIQYGEVVVLDGPGAVHAAVLGRYKARLRRRLAARRAHWRGLGLALLTLAAWGFALGLVAGLALVASLALNGAF